MMRELLIAIVASCAIGGVSLAKIPYQSPQKHYYDLSDIAVVPTVDPLNFSAEFGFSANSESVTIVHSEIPSRLARARKYKGTNPTGWAKLWCARFMAMIEPELAKKLRNPNLAVEWAKLPKAPVKPGSIVVLTRRGGGHVGIISRVLENGNLIVISGNHNHKVEEGVYSKSRILAVVG